MIYLAISTLVASLLLTIEACSSGDHRRLPDAYKVFLAIAGLGQPLLLAVWVIVDRLP